jgi:hypothetical protein
VAFTFFGSEQEFDEDQAGLGYVKGAISAHSRFARQRSSETAGLAGLPAIPVGVLPCMEFRTALVIAVYRVSCPDCGIKMEKRRATVAEQSAHSGWRLSKPNSSFFGKWPKMGVPSNSCAEPIFLLVHKSEHDKRSAHLLLNPTRSYPL